jgi:hypothetical protein
MATALAPVVQAATCRSALGPSSSTPCSWYNGCYSPLRVACWSAHPFSESRVWWSDLGPQMMEFELLALSLVLF